MYPEQSNSGYHANGCQPSGMGAVSDSENACLNNQLVSQDSRTGTLRRKLHNSVPGLVTLSLELGKNPHQVFVDTSLHDMSVSCSRGKNEGIHESTSSSGIRHCQSSGAASLQLKLAHASREAANLLKGPSSCHVHKVTVKAEAHSPEQLQAAFQDSASWPLWSSGFQLVIPLLVLLLFAQKQLTMVFCKLFKNQALTDRWIFAEWLVLEFCSLQNNDIEN